MLISAAILSLWRKTDGKAETECWNPLVCHLLDVAATADEILKREHESTRQRMAEIFGLSWENARPWLLFIGKACPDFQFKWEKGRKKLKENGLHIRAVRSSSTTAKAMLGRTSNYLEAHGCDVTGGCICSNLHPMCGGNQLFDLHFTSDFKTIL